MKDDVPPIDLARVVGRATNNSAVHDYSTKNDSDLLTEISASQTISSF